MLNFTSTQCSTGVYPFSTYPTFFEELRFLTPAYAGVCCHGVRNVSLGNNLRTY